MIAKRWVVVVAGSILLLSVLQAPAFGWSNGTGGCNSFGTHDWILKKALNAAAKKTSWVRVRVALRATDDPDCVDGIDYASSPWWHVYDIWGDEYGAAPEAAEHWFEVIQRRLGNGNERGASKALGYLAHIVGDIANPTHTDSREREERMHSAHESAVDRRISGFTFRYDGRDAADPYDRTVALAGRAHAHYFDLVDAYLRHGYNRKVHRITRRQLNRGANAVADVISSLN